ncbi:hypothetical protein DB88DRAFT_540794 [Papiliotrema laurentii]|uniref:Uncharacterized protein n=1 Tax=Papiliotrema laurentii TaxID=5418 RepID=A0AAD9CWZ1_PAPLA|nr:hypothetical protein DB88DRAFT_540794 [Papiliotrema laurentii]
MTYESFRNENLFGVKGKTCIVTGGGSGIGKGIAIALAVNGAKVIICGRRLEQIEAAAEEINIAARDSGHGGQVIAIQADVGNKQGVFAFYERCEKIIDQGNPETLQAKLLSVDDADWANMTAVHCAGPYYLAVNFIPLFQKAPEPSVCNITSLAAFFLARSVCEFSYAQSKAGETQLTQLMAAALQPFKIRVNSICPGLFPSGLTLNAEGDYHKPMAEAHSNIPKGRAGTWEEIAGIVLMLASPAGNFLNASNCVVDGGWHLNASARDI